MAKRWTWSVNEEGKLVMTKDDDAADKAKEQAASAKKVFDRTQVQPSTRHNESVSAAGLTQAGHTEGKEGGKTVRIERTAKPDLHKTFKIGKADGGIARGRGPGIREWRTIGSSDGLFRAGR